MANVIKEEFSCSRLRDQASAGSRALASENSDKALRARNNNCPFTGAQNPSKHTALPASYHLGVLSRVTK